MSVAAARSAGYYIIDKPEALVKIEDVNSKIEEHAKTISEKQTFFVALGAGIIGSCGLAAGITFAKLSAIPLTVAIGGILNLISCIAFAIFGLGAAFLLLWNQYRQAQDINALIEKDVPKEDVEFHTQKEELWSDNELTEVEKDQMRPYCNYQYHGFKQFVRVDYKSTVARGEVSMFSAKLFKITTVETGNNFESIKKEFRPWQQLLLELTTPANKAQISDDLLKVIGHCTYRRGLLNVGLAEYHGYHFITRDDGIAVFKEGKKGEPFKSAEAFRQFLIDNLNFKPQCQP